MDTEPHADATDSHAAGPYTILWIEALGEHQRRCVACLQGVGWEVQTAVTAADGKHRLQTHAFDAVVVARTLPDADGITLLDELGPITAMLAVAPGERRHAAHALRHGFACFVERGPGFDYLHSVADLLVNAIASRNTSRRQERLLNAVLSAQRSFIDRKNAPAMAFKLLLDELLGLTDSSYGFVGEVRHDSDAKRYLITRACTDIAWDAMSRAMFAGSAEGGIEFRRLDSLFGAALVSGKPVISNAPETDARSGGLPAGHPPLHAFLGIPVHFGEDLVAMVGLAGRSGGYAPADIAFLQPLSNALGQLVEARRSRAARLQAEDQLRETTELLRDKGEMLELTLDSISQGISTVDKAGHLRVSNRRHRELLDLPEALVRTNPSNDDIVRFQAERGDFGPGFERVEGAARDYVRGEAHKHTDAVAAKLPPVYLRRTQAGKVLEVRSRYLADGGWVRTFTDVTEYIEVQQALRESEARWRSLTELSSDWFWEQDENYLFTRIEGDLVAQFGIENADFIGHHGRDMAALSRMAPSQWSAHQARLAARETFQDLEVEVRRPDDGTVRWTSISGAPIFDADGRFRGYRGVGRNITDRKTAEAQIERLAFYDELTGLPNRRLLIDRLGRALGASARSGCHGALLFLDLDNFKTLNDTQGHEMGDRLLKQVGRRLVASLRETDTVARLGGDEFVVVLENLHEAPPEAAAQAEAVGRQIVAALNQPYHLEGGDHHSTPSMGIALFCDNQNSVEELLKRADLAMYQAKEAGRNTLAFFDPDIQRVVSARSALEADLRLGLQRDELLVYYQPVVDSNRRLLGVEALVRWAHPRRGMVSPFDFISVAEQTGLILPLGQKVLTMACAQLVAWAGRPQTAALTIAVNVSAREFRHPQFVENVVAVIRNSGCDPRRLKFELTESLLLQDVEDIIAKMLALKTLGVGFALDDFGTGYSSLSYLKRLPLDQLKIDQSFVRDVLTDANDATIACTIVTLAQNLGLSVVAEGVETEGQREFLVTNGCRQFQGYLFGRPAPIDALEAMIASTG